MGTYNLPKFSLDLSETKFGVRLTMALCTESLTTRFFPGTYLILSQHLPRIFKSRCFNQGNLPFCREVQDTEMGHLFEHILLEYLCELKISRGASRAIFRGETWWDWRVSRRGTYFIDIQSFSLDKKLFNEALRKSIKLFNIIIMGRQLPLISPTPPLRPEPSLTPLVAVTAGVKLGKGGRVTRQRYNK